MLPDSMNVGIIAENIRALQKEVSSIPVERIPEDYSSTTGTKTGQKWIDGKDIYQSVFTGVVPASGDPAVAFDLAYDTIVEIEGTTTNATTGAIYDADHYLTVQASAQKIRLTGTQYAGNNFMLIIRYTKPDPVPSEAKTKKKTSKKGE